MRVLWNDGWYFLKMPAGTCYEQAMERRGDFAPVDIPHDWLISDSLNLYGDASGWYRKEFSWNAGSGGRAFLTFEGVYMDSAVYVNGVKAWEWKYGYSSFNFEITELLSDGMNEIAVCVCYLSPNSRWYSGAGIYRDVYFTVTERTYIGWNDIYISSSPRGEDFVLRVETRVQGSTDGYGLEHRLYREQKGEELSAGRTEAPMQLVSRECGGAEVCEYLVSRPERWDVENPALYTLLTTLSEDGRTVQEERTSIGFRTTEFSPDKGFILNGRRLKLNGVCEHHDLGALGAAFNRAAMRRKLVKLKAMGVNAVRGAHNMTAPGFVELADELGILMISEAFDMWERPKTKNDYARFFEEYHERDVESWVKRDRNHPSVIMWSIGNEIYDTHAGVRGQEITRALADLVRRFDSCCNAAVTIGSNWMPWENAQKCADIVKLAGYNYAERYYEQHHREHPDWVIYGSETSSLVQSRGVYHFPLSAGILSEDDGQCSALGNSTTSWGARSIEDCATLDRDMEFSMGQFLWSGFDYIGEPTPYHTKNSYFGQLDTAGFPKDSYYVWQSVWTDYREKPMVHVFPYWDFNEGQLIDVRVCSNCPQVELFLNGRSLGRQSLTHEPGSGRHIIADYQVPYEKGILEASAYDNGGQLMASDVRKSFGDTAALVLRPENTVVKADGRDMLFIEIGAADIDGNDVENACDRVHVSVSGAGRLVGLDNGDSTDYDSYKGTSRRMFNGKLLAMVMSTLDEGEIKIEVSAAGVKGASRACRSIRPEGVAETAAGLTAMEKNSDLPAVSGSIDEIPVRKIELTADGGHEFTAGCRTIKVRAVIRPDNATERGLEFKAVDDNGVESKLVRVRHAEDEAVMEAVSDGSFRLRCMSRDKGGNVRVISQLEFSVEGLGKSYLDPYDFIYGSQYTYTNGNTSNGNEKGVATARDGETVVAFGNIDFGSVGSDEITVPVFALDSSEYRIEIWEGIAGEEGSLLLADAVYQKPSRWNVYQPETWKLAKVLTGVTCISFLLRAKVHIKGFSFARRDKAWLELKAVQADSIYGDSFLRSEEAVEEIGNNVSLVFEKMDFGGDGASGLTICGRAPQGSNTVKVHFESGDADSFQILEFGQSTEYCRQSFELDRVRGLCRVTFVFLPGSCFDFKSFIFNR